MAIVTVAACEVGLAKINGWWSDLVNWYRDLRAREVGDELIRNAAYMASASSSLRRKRH
jgi:hypothetical protein